MAWSFHHHCCCSLGFRPVQRRSFPPAPSIWINDNGIFTDFSGRASPKSNTSISSDTMFYRSFFMYRLRRHQDIYPNESSIINLRVDFVGRRAANWWPDNFMSSTFSFTCICPNEFWTNLETELQKDTLNFRQLQLGISKPIVWIKILKNQGPNSMYWGWSSNPQ